jgi:histone arginine demethylase JMJD6
MGEWRKKMKRARRLHRPSLKNWEVDKLYKPFPSFAKDISESSGNYQSLLLSENAPEQIPVVLDAKNLKKEDFWSKYEAKDIPCVIKSIPAGYDSAVKTKEWGAVAKWTLDALQDSHLRKRVFKCGEDDDGNSIRVKLSHFLNYVDKNYDDSPLYIFDSTFDEDGSAKDLLGDYKVPSYFADDLFGLVSEARRAPYRWFLVGPERSGSCVHIDPLATNAWNTLILGKKRWVLFPPHVPKYVVKGRGLVRKDEDDEAIHYFMNILPRIKRRATALKEHEDYRDFACYEFTQHAGETVFIPHGWWHAVLNLTDTVGVTQNFCSPRNFDSVWLATRTGRKRMAWKWLCQLDEHYPHLADRARKLNKRDHFRMKYDPVEVKRGEEYREHQRKMRKVV